MIIGTFLEFINCKEVETDIECFFVLKPEEIYAWGINNLWNRWDYIIDNKGKYYFDWIYQLRPMTN